MPAPVSPIAALVASAAGIVTLIVRLAMHERSFDLFGDEVIYTDLGRSVISGGFPRFDGPFFLHGPGFFYLEAGWARLAGLSAQPDGLDLRDAHAQLRAGRGHCRRPGPAGDAGQLATGRRRGGSALRPGAVLHRQNDRVLLETAMMFWVMLGYLVFTSLIGRLACAPRLASRGRCRLLFGCAVLTKDEGVCSPSCRCLRQRCCGGGPVSA